MIDFISAKLTDYDSDWFIKTFKPDQYANIDSGEIKYPIIHKDGNIKFLLCQNLSGEFYLKIDGSIHKYWNYMNGDEIQNHNDYSIEDIRTTIGILNEKYRLQTSSITFKNLEFGLNIDSSFDPLTVIDSNIIHHKGQSHSERKTYRNTGMFKEFDKTDFWLKIYDKGKQYSKDRSIMRLEVKIKRARAIKKHGINSLTDLYNPECLKSLFRYLIGQVNDLCIVDRLNVSDQLSGSENAVFNMFIHREKLNEFKNSNSRTTLSTYWKKFYAILDKYDLQQIKTEILNKLQKKFGELVQVYDFHKIELPILETHYFTFSTDIINGKCKVLLSKYPNYIYQLDPDHPDRKKLRNESSNSRNRLRYQIENTLYQLSKGSLFPIAEQFTLSMDEINSLRYWRGTKYDILKELGIIND